MLSGLLVKRRGFLGAFEPEHSLAWELCPEPGNGATSPHFRFDLSRSSRRAAVSSRQCWRCVMEIVVERASGLDVRKASVTACVRLPTDRRSEREEHVQTFATTVSGLLVLVRLARRARCHAGRDGSDRRLLEAGLGGARGSLRVSARSTPATSSRSRAARPMSATRSGSAGSPKPACCARAWCRPSRSASCGT